MRRPSSVRLSVCPSVCKHFCNRFFYQTNGWIATKLAHHGPQTGLHPGYAQGRGQRSRDRDTFCDFAKIASSHRQMAGSPPNLHTMVSRLVCADDVLNLKVDVKLHAIRALIWFHKNRFFSQANGCILTKLSLLLTSYPLSVRFSSAFQSPNGSPSNVSKSWNELLRHWQSSFVFCTPMSDRLLLICHWWV